MKFCEAPSTEKETILRKNVQYIYISFYPLLFSAPYWFSLLSFKQKSGYSPFTTSRRAVKTFKEIFTATVHAWHSKVFTEWSLPLFASTTSWCNNQSFLLMDFLKVFFKKTIMYSSYSFQQIIYSFFGEVPRLISSILNSINLSLSVQWKVIPNQSDISLKRRPLFLVIFFSSTFARRELFPSINSYHVSLRFCKWIALSLCIHLLWSISNAKKINLSQRKYERCISSQRN